MMAWRAISGTLLTAAPYLSIEIQWPGLSGEGDLSPDGATGVQQGMKVQQKRVF